MYNFQEDIGKYRFHMFGIAAIWIFFRHTIHIASFSYFEPFEFLFSWGDCGVDVFLLLSGYGIYHSLDKEINIKSYVKKRLRRMMPPVLLFWVAISAITKDTMFWNPVHLANVFFSSYWYIVMIILCYGLAYIIYLMKKHLLGIFLITEFLCITFIVVMRFYGKETHLYNVYVARFPCFVLGMLLSHLTVYGLYKILFCLKAGSVLLLLGLAFMFFIPMEYKDFRRILYIVPSVGLLFTVPFALNFSHKGFLTSLSFIGKMSLEFYLYHAFIMVLYLSRINNATNSQFMTILIISVATVLSSLVAKKTTNYISGVL